MFLFNLNNWDKILLRLIIVVILIIVSIIELCFIFIIWLKLIVKFKLIIVNFSIYLLNFCDWVVNGLFKVMVNSVLIISVVVELINGKVDVKKSVIKRNCFGCLVIIMVFWLVCWLIYVLEVW